MSEIELLKNIRPEIKDIAEGIGERLAENYRKGLKGRYHNRLSKGIEIAIQSKTNQLCDIINQLLYDRKNENAETTVNIPENELAKRALILGLWSCRPVYIDKKNKIQVKSKQIYRDELYIPKIDISHAYISDEQDQDNQEKIETIDEVREKINDKSEFDLDKIKDERNKIHRSITERHGQPAFREALKKAYSNRCVITGCDIQELLEAAHIVPYRGDYTNDIRNGLLLRADIHTLFDIGLIGIDSASYQVVISDNLKKTEYEGFSSKKLRLPSSPADYPSKEALDWHRKEYNL